MSPKNFDSMRVTAPSMIITLTCLRNTYSLAVNGHMRTISMVISKLTLPIDKVMELDVDNITKKRGKLALDILRDGVVTCLLFENAKEMYSLYRKSEYASLFEFKLKVSQMLCKLVIKFSEDTLFRYESFGGKLPRVDDNGNTDDDDDEVNDDDDSNYTEDDYAELMAMI